MQHGAKTEFKKWILRIGLRQLLVLSILSIPFLTFISREKKHTAQCSIQSPAVQDVFVVIYDDIFSEGQERTT